MDIVENAWGMLLDKCSQRPEFVAFYLKQYQQLKGITQEGIYDFLQCDEDCYRRLATCKVPNPADQDYAARVEKIAAFAQVQPDKLYEILTLRLDDRSQQAGS